MAVFPHHAIIFVNNDLTEQVKNYLKRQLFIDTVMDGYSFDQEVDGYIPDGYDGYDGYGDYVRKSGRIMVLRDFSETMNREAADVVVFVKSGMAAVENNKYGPPGFTVPARSLYWGLIGIF